MLIPCPNCGKPISDLAKECIHCKTVINAEPEEQKELQKQFVSEEPEIAKPMVKDALLHRIFVICGIFLLCFLVLGVLFLILNRAELKSAIDFPLQALLPSMIFLGLGLLLAITLFILNFIQKSIKDSVFKALKHFEKWLKKKNIVNLELFFDSAKDAEQYENSEIE